MSSQRKLAVSGTFYSNNCEQIKKQINHFNLLLDKHKLNKTFTNAKAIIVPHAGYVYSGFTANAVYNTISQTTKKRIVVIGPSHKVRFEGLSVACYNHYPTPCGEIKIDKEYSLKLVNKYIFASFNDMVHNEHSTETQFPFIQHYFKDIEVIEIVYGRIDVNSLSQVVQEIMNDKNNLLVISTDLSHFHTLEKAKQLDNICINAIMKKDLNLFDTGCEACGIIGVKAMTKVAKELNLEIKLLDYRTSFDVSKDSSRVVGYSGFVMLEQ